jgi:hypothetical protein
MVDNRDGLNYNRVSTLVYLPIDRLFSSIFPVTSPSVCDLWRGCYISRVDVSRLGRCVTPGWDGGDVPDYLVAGVTHPTVIGGLVREFYIYEFCRGVKGGEARSLLQSPRPNSFNPAFSHIDDREFQL